MVGSHGLLLRLLTAYFSVNIALKYLQTYSDNIGISYFLTRRLASVDTSELIGVWGFICHLLLTRPSSSRALECFVIDVSQRSTHIALLTLWFLQAALQDMLARGHDSPSFHICQRMLHRCHEIIFSDHPAPSTSPYASLKVTISSRLPRRKVRHHAEPATVGIGMVLASIAHPQMAQIMGEVALEQGRAEEDVNELRSIETGDAAEVPILANDTGTSVPSSDEQHPDIQDLQAGSQTAEPSSSVSASRTVPALPLHLQSVRRSRMSEDPLGQLDRELPSTPSQSTPSLSSARPSSRPSTANLAESLLQRYDQQSQIQLLRNHYCRSEVQFILNLENISNRLLVVPRPARVSALRAELTALNHKLPAEICMPLWCTTSDHMLPGTSVPQPHHKIVRIPPGESVVLNSAERAPYLLYIEILNDELNFDPSRRSNKEVLKKIVVREAQQSGGLVNSDTSSSLPSHQSKSHSLGHFDVDVSERAPSPSFTSAPRDLQPRIEVSAEDEEMDLVEQLYGTDASLRSNSADLSDSIVLPPPPKNKELDKVAWSIPPSPAIGPDFGASLLDPVMSSSPQVASPLSSQQNHSISLEEYSERMRTAAIMLAQLNASVGRDTAVSSMIPGLSSDSTVTPSMGWLTSSSWLGSASGDQFPPVPPQSADANAGPVHPSLRGARPEGQHVSTSKMRLSATDAAAIRDRIMQEMLSLEEERMDRMREYRVSQGVMRVGDVQGSNTAEDENIIRKELDKADPSAAVFSESWATKKSRIRNESPYGHLANWDCISVIIKTGGDLRQEQLAIQLIREFQQIWKEENVPCWVRPFQIVITGGTSGLMETITDAVSIHSIKKAEYARRLASGGLGHVSLLDHFKRTYGDPSSAKYSRAQKNFASSLAGYSVISFLLQIKDRHNGNILLDRDGHLIHIDFGFILSNSPGNIGFEAAPFKLPMEYVEVLGGVEGPHFLEFRRLFHEGFKAARKHCDRIITLVELMQKDSTLPCFAAFGEQTAAQLRERFQPSLTHMLIGEYVDKLVDSSLFSNWTRLYDLFQYHSQSIL